MASAKRRTESIGLRSLAQAQAVFLDSCPDEVACRLRVVVVREL
jgi:hypothetical protein